MQGEPKQRKGSSRRKFIAGLGGAALATAGAATLSTVGCQKSAPTWSAEFDWVCVGSGIAGCAAAIAGHDKGLRTLVIDKAEQLGGTSTQSSGILWVPMNYMAKVEGIQDSREDALAYLNYVSGGYSLPEYREAFVDNAARVFEYLCRKADFAFSIGGSEFYYPIAPGSQERGRLVIPIAFPAETLGAWRDRVQNSVFIRGLAEAWEGATESKNTDRFGPYRYNEAAIALWKKRMDPAKVDAVIKADGEKRVGGAGLIAYAMRALIKRGVEIRTATKAEKLVMDGDRAVGLAVLQNEKSEYIRARKGVLLAMGGNVNGRGGHGDSWILAAEAGAALSNVSVIIAMITLPGPGERFPGEGPFGRPNIEVGFTHSAIVNRFGERFGDESFFQAFGAKFKDFDVMGEHQFRNFPCYLVFDRTCLEKNSFVGLPAGNTEQLEWVSQGQTIAELAGKLKMPADKLQATVARFNEFARRGKDEEFNRKPATMGGLEKPPFYGVMLDAPDPYRADMHIAISPQGQVLRAKDQKPIPGLYACGATASTDRIWGIGYQAGHSLMSGATFGFLAAEHAAAFTA